MIFRSCSINGQEYPHDVDYETHSVLPNDKLKDDLTNKRVMLEDEKKTIVNFFLGLSICNTVTVGLMDQDNSRPSIERIKCFSGILSQFPEYFWIDF